MGIENKPHTSTWLEKKINNIYLKHNTFFLFKTIQSGKKTFKWNHMNHVFLICRQDNGNIIRREFSLISSH